MEEFKCNFCTNIFHDPVLLPCGDAVCKRCLKDYLKLNQVTRRSGTKNRYADKDEKYYCPICDARFCLVDGVDSLPKFGVISKMINDSLRTNDEGGFGTCDFCSKSESAVLKCFESGYKYCNECFDSIHANNETKVKHMITSTQVNNFDFYHVCKFHTDEKKKLLCTECGVCICFLCKEIGSHKSHKTELAINKCDIEVEKLYENLHICQSKSLELTTNIQKVEQFAFDLKQSGLMTEANVNRECDQLIELIEEKRAKMLEEIDTKYCGALNMLNTNLEVLSTNHSQFLKMQDIISYAIGCEDPVAILESIPGIEKKFKEVTLKAIEDISQCKKLVKVFPFKGMIVDSQSAKKALRQFYWLLPPREAQFQVDACQVENNKVFLVWKQSLDKINKFYLEKSSNGVEFEVIYEGQQSFFDCVNLKYNEKVYFCVYASNQAGKGSLSKIISFKTAQGFTFKIDQTKTHPTVKISRDFLSFRVKSTGSREVFTNAVVKSGQHFWQIKVDQIIMNKEGHGSISLGVIGDNDIEKRNTLLYILQFNPNNQNKKVSTNMVLNYLESPSDLIDQNLSFVLDLDNLYFDIFMNGRLQIPNLLNKHSFTNIEKCGYSVFVNVTDLCIQMSFVNGLIMPLKPPDSPVFLEEECLSTNLAISYKWETVAHGIDCYLLEVVKDKKSFGDVLPVYRGRGGYFLYETKTYNETLYARLFAINVVGMSKPSKIIALSTPNGINFSFEHLKKKSLQLWEENRSVEYSSNEPVLLFANYLLNRGVHFWRFQLEHFQGKSSKIGFGLAKYGISIKDFGITDSFAVLVSKAPQDNLFGQTIYVVEKHICQSDIAFLVDMSTRKLYCYFNGVLLLQKNDTQLNVKQICSFSDVPAKVVPCVMLVGNVKVLLKCNIPLPGVPAPSFFKYFVCENISCHFEWTPSSRAGSYTDYFILKVAVIAVTSQQLPNEEKFEEVYRGTRTVFVLHPVKYNSKIIASVTSVNYAGESMESERVTVYSATGFRFKFNGNKSDVLELDNDGYAVQLKVRVHSFALGNELIKVGFHSWSIKIDEFFDKNHMSVVGIGLSKFELNDPILGEDSFSYALQIIEHPKVNLCHTKHRYQTRMNSSKACGTVVTVDVNLDEHWVNIYLNGTRLCSDENDPNKPTFESVYGEFYPAVSLYGSHLKLSIVND